MGSRERWNVALHQAALYTYVYVTYVYIIVICIALSVLMWVFYAVMNGLIDVDEIVYGNASLP